MKSKNTDEAFISHFSVLPPKVLLTEELMKRKKMSSYLHVVNPHFIRQNHKKKHPTNETSSFSSNAKPGKIVE